MLLDPNRLSREHTIEHGTEKALVSLDPVLGSGPAKGRRVTLGRDRNVSVIIELDPLTPPKDRDRARRGEHDVDGSLKVLRPCLDRAERRCRPVEGADERAHLASFGEERMASSGGQNRGHEGSFRGQLPKKKAGSTTIRAARPRRHERTCSAGREIRTRGGKDGSYRPGAPVLLCAHVGRNRERSACSEADVPPLLTPRFPARETRAEGQKLSGSRS
jgi:hypothetical protein